MARETTAVMTYLNELVVVDQAENVIGLARLQELAAVVKSARARAAAAQDEVGRAELAGSIEQAATARQAAHVAVAEFGRILEAAVAEMEQISPHRRDR